jgi:2-methylcitrate dehydratase
MKRLEEQLAAIAYRFRTLSVGEVVLAEARKRVLDSLGCFYGAFDEKAVRALRETFAPLADGEATLWGMSRRSSPSTAAWLNGAGVRALDYNDTYLSKEPCHPSDLISSLWAACEVSGRSDQGKILLRAMVLAYEVMCRLCDAASLRTRGWDHVTYLPIASAAGCAYVLGLTTEQTRNAIALAAVANNALRQTRVGTISDWKAACAAYAAQAGLNATLLARNGFTGPSDIFSGKHGFFAQVSGRFELPLKGFGSTWKIIETHTKFFPAEHHAQSVIEAALEVRAQLLGPLSGPLPLRGLRSLGEREHLNLKTSSSISLQNRPALGAAESATINAGLPLPLRERAGVRALLSIKAIIIDVFEVGAAIIGSEKEKWAPSTRETADHSFPYLTVVALLDGTVSLQQYQRKRYLQSDVKRLMKRVRVRRHAAYDRLYPRQLPTRLTIRLRNGKTVSSEVLRPKGYAGRPMSWADVEEKFRRLSSPVLSSRSQTRVVSRVAELERVKRLSSLQSMLRVSA